MVARGVVREAHTTLEALQVRLKEVRDRLDRVSREEAHYLELATLEHKLLQVGSGMSAWMPGHREIRNQGETDRCPLFSLLPAGRTPSPDCV